MRRGKSDEDKAQKRIKKNTLTTVTKSRAGKVGVTGKRQALKESQVYPPKFALAVVRNKWPERFQGAQ